MFNNLFGKTKVQKDVAVFNPNEKDASQLYQFIVSEMRAWGRPTSKMILTVQLCSLDMRMKKTTEEGNVSEKLRLFIRGLSDDEFELYMDQIYGSKVCSKSSLP